MMRLHRLLSPHRVAAAPAKAHDGRICTDAPNVRWATDGAKVWTSEDGWLWVFTTVEHWNGELLGHHVCKRGDRLAAYEPVSQALLRVFGSALADVARGVELRHDHGSQYLTDYFQGQSRFHGFTPSFALVGEPQTNGEKDRIPRGHIGDGDVVGMFHIAILGHRHVRGERAAAEGPQVDVRHALALGTQLLRHARGTFQLETMSLPVVETQGHASKAARPHPGQRDRAVQAA
jgi:transposase InsO family protein